MVHQYTEAKCGCLAVYLPYDELEIEHCPLHKAAPKLYEACRLVVERIDGFNYPIAFEYPFIRVIEALAEVEK